MTPKSLKDAIDIELHPAAVSTALSRINEFAVSLVLEAKRIAFKNKADIVMSSHIEESLEVLNSKRKEKVGKQVAQIVGGAFFGAFIQGFISEISAGSLANILLIAIYVLVGFTGVGLFTWGLRK